MSERRQQMLIFLVAGSMFMENLDGTIIVTALPAMAKAFGTSAIALNVGVSAYLLALGVFIPASGWVAERFGTRRTFASAITMFMLASALCGLAEGLPFFASVRVLQGAAGAMMVPVGRLVVLRNTPNEKRMAAMASLIWPALIAPVLGPPLGGFITTHAGWRWIFYLNLPLGALALLLTFRILPDFRADQRLPFDWRGFLLCGGGILFLVAGFERLVVHVDATSFALMVSGMTLLAASWRHFERAAAPMIDISVWSIPTFRIAMRGGSLFRMAIASVPFLLPLMFEVGFGFTPEKAGLLMLAVFCADFGAKSVTNRVIRAFGFRTIFVRNGVLSAAVLASCALLSATTPIPLIVLVLALAGATRSMQFTTIGTIIYADVPEAQMPGVSVVSTTVAQLSMGAGIALAAIGARIGAGVRTFAGTTPVDDFRIAFLAVSVVALCGLIDAVRLPKNAGDALAARRAA